VSDLHFDPYQFANRGAFPVSAETCLAFSDYHTMHTKHRAENPAAWVPPFALNDKQLQQVLLLRAWRYVHNRGIPPTDLNKINADATAKALKGNSIAADAPAIQREMVKAHIAAVRKAGGYLQLHAAIAFRSWRLGMTSVEVAESLGMTPYAVRVALWRLRDAAKKLGFDAGRVGHTAGMRRKPKEKLRKKFNSANDVAKAVQLRKEGKTLNAIGREFGVSKATVWFALRKAGRK
jgi:hypothetical protein